MPKSRLYAKTAGLWDTQPIREEKAQRTARLPGYGSYKCPICHKGKQRGTDHTECRKQLSPPVDWRTLV